MNSPILTAVAWPYANGPRHIGHVSGFGVPSDVFSRYMRMAGNDVLMVSGTDEHGTAIQVQAESEGLTPQQTADKYHRVIAEDLQGLGCCYDLYTRTTTLNHRETVQELFRALYVNGYVAVQREMGAISPSTSRTLPDRYIEGTCPHCGFDGARGDQCDNCGRQLDPIDLINPRSRINGEAPQFIETEHFFLDLPALATSLRAYLDGRDSLVEEIRAVVPFNLRPLDQPLPRDLGNRFGLVTLPLPVGLDTPAARLEAVMARMADIKRSPEGPVAYAVLSAIGVTPVQVEHALVDLFSANGSTVLTNVPGPRQTVYLAGSPVRGVLVWAPVSGSMAMSISILSYAGAVTAGVMSDAGLVPDPEAIVEAFGMELRALEALPAPDAACRPRPGQ